MMGHSHAVSGVALWLGVSAVSTVYVTSSFLANPAAITLSTNLIGVEGLVPLFLGAAIASGAALLPDLDHQNATAAKSFPPISTFIAKGIQGVSGGHRHGTHSLLGLVIATALAYLAANFTVAVPPDIPLLDGRLSLGAGIMAFLLVVIGLRCMKVVPGGKFPWIVGKLAFLSVAAFAPDNNWWLPLAVGVGYLAHLIGDALTVQLIPWLWPWHPKPKKESRCWGENGYMGVPILGVAGSAREALFEVLLILYSVVVAALAIIDLPTINLPF